MEKYTEPRDVNEDMKIILEALRINHSFIRYDHLIVDEHVRKLKNAVMLMNELRKMGCILIKEVRGKNMVIITKNGLSAIGKAKRKKS